MPLTMPMAYTRTSPYPKRSSILSSVGPSKILTASSNAMPWWAMLRRFFFGSHVKLMEPYLHYVFTSSNAQERTLPGGAGNKAPRIGSQAVNRRTGADVNGPIVRIPPVEVGGRFRQHDGTQMVAFHIPNPDPQ